MKKLLPLILIFGAGCIAVPSNEYSFGDFKVKTPKDMEVEDISIQGKGSNFTFKAKKISSRNNPAVITSTGEEQVKIIEATGKVAADVAAQVARSMVK